MLKDHTMKNISKATVCIVKKGGQGVLVGGNLIVTAAHCITFDVEGGMVLGDYFIEEIKTKGRNLRVGPLAVEPVSDIAVLGALDEQAFGKEVDKYKAFCQKTSPVPLCIREFEPFQDIPVYTYTRKKAWVRGRGIITTEYANMFSVETRDEIVPGDSGSPVVNETGELIGVISHAWGQRESKLNYGGSVSFLRFALPVWVLHKIFPKTELKFAKPAKKKP